MSSNFYNASSNMSVYGTEFTTAELVTHMAFIYPPGVVGLFGNVVVLMVLCKKAEFQSPPFLLIADLAVTDFCVLIITMTMMAPNIYTTHLLGEPMIKGSKSMCEALGFFGDSVVGHEVLCLLLIAVNRYVAVLHIQSYKRLFTKKRTLIYIIIFWLLAISLMVGPVVGWGQIGYDNNYFVCKYDERSSQSYSMFLYARFLASMLGLPFCYLMILYKLNKSKRAAKKGAAKKGKGQDQSGGNNLLIQFAIVTSFFYAFGVVHGLNNMMMEATGEPLPKISLFIAPIMTMNSSLNPIIFFIFNAAFRKVALGSFRRQKRRVNVVSVSTLQTSRG